MPELITTGFFITELFTDMVFVLKIFVLLTIWGFVRNRIGNSFLAAIVLLGSAWFILFDMFWFFGGVYILVMLGMLGAASILIDFYFVGGGEAIKGVLGKITGKKEGEEHKRQPMPGMQGEAPDIESPVSTSGDLIKRQQQISSNMQRMNMQRRGR